MYLVLLTLVLLTGLTIARRWVEPSCPGCSAKRWLDTPARLECTACGWTNFVQAPAPITVDVPPLV